MIVIGKDRGTRRPVSVSADAFRTHLHLIGATGAGKTTAILTLLRPILSSLWPKNALFVVDPMGNLSHDLLRWIVNERICPPHVRDRLIYIEPAREDVVLPFNPLLHDSSDHLYYQVGRAVEIVLRAWASQNIEEMPRLRHWTFASFFAAAAMGYPIAACRYLLRPGTPEHAAMLTRLPPELRLMWSEILKARGSESIRILESTRNRLAPFFDSGILRRMFASTENRFDVAKFIRERRIVILNVAGYGRLDRHIANTIGGLAVNEIIESAMNMSREEVDPTYLLLDEFQHFVSMDLYDALPAVRQLGLRLILAHQSFAQLERGDIDLTGLIWQARSRMMFANDAEDADLLAHELATMTYDPFYLKEVLHSRRQRIAGHRKEWLESLSSTSSYSSGSNASSVEIAGETSGHSQHPKASDPTRSRGTSSGTNRGQTQTHSNSSGRTEGRSQSLVPVHEDFLEVSSKTYFSFEEQKIDWAKKLRQRPTGACFARFKDDPQLYDLQVDRLEIPETPRLREKIEELKERNFSSELFVPAAVVEQRQEELRLQLLQGGEVPRLTDESETARSTTPERESIRDPFQ